MFNKEQYIAELKLQLQYVTDVEEWDEIWDAIRYLEEESN